jgi:uncharacterized protein (TIGR03435 family)
MRHLIRKVVSVVAIISTAVLPVESQTPPSQKPSFEVASVKASASGDDRIVSQAQPVGRWRISNAALKLLIAMAYSVRRDQVSGGPNWIDADRWNIEAKAEERSIPPELPSPSPTTPNHPLTLMLQSLLEDRFQLKIHRETKEEAVYELTVAKNGPRIKLSADQGSVNFPALPQAGSPPPNGLMRLGRGSLEGRAIPITSLAMILSEPPILGRQVIDKTGMHGLYDFTLEWTPDPGQGPVVSGGREPSPPSVNTSGSSIFTAIQEQLGLRLQSARGPVEVIVIDSVQKPSEN